MPIYHYTCKSGHTTESRQGYGVTAIPCPICEAPALRDAIYVEQSIVTETGMKSGRKAEVPRDEKRHNLSLFREASAELDYKHKKAEEIAQRELPTPSYYKMGVEKARRIKAGKEKPIS